MKSTPRPLPVYLPEQRVDDVATASVARNYILSSGVSFTAVAGRVGLTRANLALRLNGRRLKRGRKFPQWQQGFFEQILDAVDAEKNNK